MQRVREGWAAGAVIALRAIRDGWDGKTPSLPIDKMGRVKNLMEVLAHHNPP